MLTTNNDHIHTDLRIFSLDFSNCLGEMTTVSLIIVLNSFKMLLFLTLSRFEEASEV